jgi:DNA-binding NarL/FixJ family response regulator
MPLTLLVVEDDPAIALALVDHFTAEGYSTVAAETAEAALELIPLHRPHLLLADITLPQMDGYELVRRIRLIPSCRLLPVIFLTARGQVEDRVRGYRLGCDVYIAKPFDFLELTAVVRNLLDRHQILQSELYQRQENTNQLPTVRSPASPALELSVREAEILAWLCQGQSNRQIGQHLSLSPRTVEKYVSKLLLRTETTNRADLVRYAMENRLVTL